MEIGICVTCKFQVLLRNRWADLYFQVLTAPDLTYASSFALINTKLIALVNLQTDTLDIHRILDGASCTLQRVGQLCLPFPQAEIHPHSASFRLAQAYPPMCSSRSQCLPFRPSPDACLVGLTAVLAAQDGTMTFNWLAMRRDYLCSIADTTRDSDEPTPWEKWSVRTACCVEIEHLLAAPTPAGARWIVHSQPLVVREFGLSCSQRIRANRTHLDEDESDVVLRGALQDIFASQLPYCDIISVGERRYQSVTADYEWVVGINEEVCSIPSYLPSMIFTHMKQYDEFSRKTHRIDIHHVL